MGVYDAIAHFNYGEKAALDILELINIEPGTYTKSICNTINKERKRRSAYRMSENQKKRRKMIRGLKKKSKIRT